jgi:hypothetical protein
VDARTQKTQGCVFPLARARTGDEIPDPASLASLRPEQPGQLALFEADRVDPRYDHVWRTGRPSKALPPYSPQLKGRRCRVRCRAAQRYGPLLREHPGVETHLLPAGRNVTGCGSCPANVGVELDDGTLICAERWTVGRVTP